MRLLAGDGKRRGRGGRTGHREKEVDFFLVEGLMFILGVVAVEEEVEVEVEAVAVEVVDFLWLLLCC